MSRTWPHMVLRGAIRGGIVDGLADVNLLVTDGDPSVEPAGYGMRSIAAITGARYLAAMSQVDSTPYDVDYSPPAAIAQLLLHDCGHAVGLEHRH